MMSSGSYSAWMDARNIEDVLDAHDPDHDPEDGPMGASEPYGDMADDWLDWQEDMPLPIGEDAVFFHRDALPGDRCVSWNAAYLGDFEARLGGCLDSRLL